MNCKVYISDEGFGPLVRESAIIEEFKLIDNAFKFTIQTERHAAEVARIIPGTTVIKQFNNIQWNKESDGSPDISEIKRFFADYPARSNAFIELEKDNFNYDFVISDFVYEAFQTANIHNTPSLGISHFTWDWFFSKLFPPPLSNQVLQRFFDYANKAEVLYFPPFTPVEIANHYKKKAIHTPLIVRKKRTEGFITPNSNFKILIMDSGPSVLASQIQKAVEKIHLFPDITFYMSSKFTCEADNAIYIEPTELFSDYIPFVDLVITRAGFNTISECIAYKTPVLLIGEAVNPEMLENMLNIKKAGLGSIVDIKTFVYDFVNFLPRFIENEYKLVLHHMKNNDMPINGAEVIVEDILNRINY